LLLLSSIQTEYVLFVKDIIVQSEFENIFVHVQSLDNQECNKKSIKKRIKKEKKAAKREEDKKTKSFPPDPQLDEFFGSSRFVVDTIRKEQFCSGRVVLRDVFRKLLWANRGKR